MELTSTIEKIWTTDKDNKPLIAKNGKSYKKIIIDGMFFNDFNNIQVKEGDRVKIDYELNGQFTNLNSLEVLEADETATQETVETPQPKVEDLRRMKIKVVEARKCDELEKKMNDFNEDHNVHYTQTHIKIAPDGSLFCVAVFFYKE